MDFEAFLKNKQRAEKVLIQHTPRAVKKTKKRIVRSDPVAHNEMPERYSQHSENQDKGVPELKELHTAPEQRCVVIDSRDRNRDKYPDSSDFRVMFNPGADYDGAGLFTELRNVTSIRLVECILPATVRSYSHLVLVIPELSDNLLGTNDILRKSFATLLPDRSETATDDFVRCRINDMCNCFRKYDPPRARISSFTLQFYTPSGDIVNLGTDTSSPTAVDDTVQVLCIFEVTMSVSNKRMAIQSRIV